MHVSYTFWTVDELSPEIWRVAECSTRRRNTVVHPLLSACELLGICTSGRGCMDLLRLMHAGSRLIPAAETMGPDYLIASE